jgi:DsbC/DsbD-like thiol-disulfide interchange protein
VPIEIEVDDPTQSNAMTAAAAIAPAKAKAGETVTFAVRAKTAANWHIYAFDHAGVGSPTKLELELPADVTAEGAWSAPEAHPYASLEPSLVYEGDMMFQHTLKIAEGATPGPREVKCRLGYQTCNDAMCNPPTAMELSAAFQVE